MTKKPSFYIIWFIIIMAALAIGLSFITPWAPLLVLASLVIQVPIIVGVMRNSINGAYLDRAFERRKQYDEDGDAAAWLAAEEKEAAGAGYRFWSSGAKAQSALNRAAALVALCRCDEAAEQLAEVDENKLIGADRRRFDETAAAVREGRVPQAAQPD